MSLHEKSKFNTESIKSSMRDHRLETEKASVLSDAFRLGWVAAHSKSLEVIASLPTPKNEDVMNGHEDAYRAVEDL